MAKMETKQYSEDRQNFVATRMSLPLFMISRNRLREDHLDGVQKQFKLAGQHYNANCHKENRGEDFSAATYAHYKHITGFNKAPSAPYPQPRPLKCDRSMTTWRSYQQAPNRYGVLPVPYLSRQGTKGTLFAKMHTNKSLVSIKMPGSKFYELPAEIERFFKPENKQKGIFLSNARDRRPTTRIMITDQTSCYRNPAEPGPCDTHTAAHEMCYNMAPVTESEPENPHLFLRHSCVPDKISRLLRRHISFEPGPGRYDVRFPNVCACERGRQTMPRLQMLIEQQKRLKFRRLPYKRINAKRYCEPDWRHVEGYGHRHVFIMGKHDLPKPRAKKIVKAKKGEKSEKQLKLFAEGKYINMLSNPKRYPMSTRDYALAPYEPRIVYNCIAKRIVRKQLRNNKKIAFMSGQERWKDGVRPLQLTARQLEEIKARLPDDRRLTDRPLELRASKIVSQLHHVPEHMRVSYMPQLRKRLFKFLPVPTARVLVTDSDIRPDVSFDPEHPTGLYNVKIEEESFYRDSVLEDMEKGARQQEQDTTHSPSVVSIAPSIGSRRSNLSRHSSSVRNSRISVTVLNPSEQRAREIKSVVAAEVAKEQAATVAAEVAAN
ncbi:CG13870 [Drosophila busckii]|uniref:CG13870 n=1 Tax=Drosophila busckii TaxID=30019 RepID=A0A0M4EAU1_DROBS|nr:uncharacterized protein LOC108595267 [Drosophila busckii]ALC42258.1 CG13870 [Drosophila busckii]